ncbi:MAG: HAD family hydrolase [Syntrophales bacterium]|nr:HAD family hydrolase [Syntrophales bacterium]
MLAVKPRNSPKLLLFDFDGVIVDSLHVYSKAVKWCLERIGKPLISSTEDYLNLFEENFYEALERRGVDLTAFLTALKEYSTLVNYYENVNVIPGILPVLEELSHNNILAIISSNSRGAIERIFSRFSVGKFFKSIMGSDDSYSKKNKMEKLMAVYGISKNDTLYIGDTAGDIREGKLAGVITVGVAWGWHPKDRLENVKPDYIVNSPEELLKLPVFDQIK